MRKQCETNDSRASKITFLDLPGRLQIQASAPGWQNGKKITKKWQTHDSGAGTTSNFGFSRSAPGLATRAGRENDKKMRKTCFKKSQKCKTK